MRKPYSNQRGAFHGGPGSTGGAGGMGGGGAKCAGPESCNDGDACTTDFCTTEGSCAWASKCPGNRCCSRECAERCDDVDCDDQVSCTQKVCFAGRCAHASDDSMGNGGSCLPEHGGCVECNSDAQCNDNTCTTDACDLATHTSSDVFTCECKTTAECSSIVAAAIPIGKYCHSCVDGKCKMVLCGGNCCTSGCYIGPCPD